MVNEWLSYLWEHYNILGSLAAMALIAGITIAGKWLLFKHPELAEMRRINKEEDKKRWKKEKYPPMVRASQRVGKYCNIVFFFLLLPFCITFEAQPWWQVLLDIFVILMVYDFFYYCAHRFWFHGNGPMRPCTRWRLLSAWAATWPRSSCLRRSWARSTWLPSC